MDSGRRTSHHDDNQWMARSAAIAESPAVVGRRLIRRRNMESTGILRQNMTVAHLAP